MTILTVCTLEGRPDSTRQGLIFNVGISTTKALEPTSDGTIVNSTRPVNSTDLNRSGTRRQFFMKVEKHNFTQMLLGRDHTLSAHSSALRRRIHNLKS